MEQASYAVLMQKVRPLKPVLSMGIAELVLQFLILGIGFYLSALPGIFWFTGQLILGIAFWRSFAILHAAGHHAFSSNKILDHAAGFINSLFCFIPFYSWKYIHHDHHIWTGWQDIDPTTKGLSKVPSPFTLKLLNIAWKCWIPVISIHYIGTVFMNPASKDLTASARRLPVFSSIIFLFFVHGTLMANLGTDYLRYFFLSTFLYLNLGDLSLLTQHVHLPLDHSHGNEVRPKSFSEQDQYSHTTLMPEFVSRWIVLGFNHHALHHLFPALPYYHSHKVHYQGEHTHDWKEWLMKAKKMKASELIFHTKRIS